VRWLTTSGYPNELPVLNITSPADQCDTSPTGCQVDEAEDSVYKLVVEVMMEERVVIMKGGEDEQG
jgi:hypothetical protein